MIVGTDQLNEVIICDECDGAETQWLLTAALETFQRRGDEKSIKIVEDMQKQLDECKV